MKTLKIIGAIIAVLVVATIIMVYVGLKNINGLVESAVEKVGPQVTQTQVTLDKADITLMEGRGSLQGLTIFNPEGFDSDYAFQMGEVALQLDVSSLNEPVIVIKEVLIDGAKLIAEEKNLSQTNLQALLENVKGSSSSSSSASASDQGDEDSAVRLMVEKFTFKNSDVRLVSQQLGERTLKLPAVNINDIGDRKNGLSPKQLAEQLLQPVLAQARRQVTEELRKEAEGKLKSKLEEKLSEQDKGKVEQLKSLFGK